MVSNGHAAATQIKSTAIIFYRYANLASSRQKGAGRMGSFAPTVQASLAHNATNGIRSPVAFYSCAVPLVETIVAVM